MQLTTQQKQDYLATMGVDPWYPRMTLPNALAPAVLSKPDMTPADAIYGPQSPQVVPEQAVSPSVTSSSSPADTASEAPRVPSAPMSADPAPASVAATPATSGSRAIHFGLGLYVIGQWLVVSTLSGSYQTQQDAAFRLLLAILKQFNNKEQEPAYHHVIAWPFFSNPNADQGKTAATQYVNGVIEHLVEEHQVTRLLSFGGVLAKLNDWDDAEGDDFGLTRLNLPSLFKMLADPSQKAKAWQLMQASSLYRS